MSFFDSYRPKTRGQMFTYEETKTTRPVPTDRETRDKVIEAWRKARNRAVAELERVLDEELEKLKKEWP